MLFLKRANIYISIKFKRLFHFIIKYTAVLSYFKESLVYPISTNSTFLKIWTDNQDLYCKTNFKQISILKHLKIPKSCQITQPSQLTTSFIQIPLPFDKKLFIGVWTRLLVLLEEKKQIVKGANIYSRVRKIMEPLPTSLSIL